jgi:ribosomal protein S4
MARYTGPKSRIARKFGEGIFGADKVLSKKNYPPGQHGNSRKRKTSEYGVQLREKQKAKYTYGVLEKQFRNLFEKAETAKGITGEILLQLLEGRLDNIVFRLGIAPTRAAARQLVSHKHITVDGEVVKATFQQLEKDFTSNTFSSLSLLKQVAELFFQNAISIFGFLFLTKLNTVFRSLSLSGITVLSGRIVLL